MAEEVKTEETKAPQPAPVSGEVPNPAVAEAAKNPDLNISDLNAVKSIIDIATTRGSFRANELEAVGKTYNKLNAFLEHVTKTQAEQQKAQGENPNG